MSKTEMKFHDRNLLWLEYLIVFLVFWFLLHGLPLTVDDTDFGTRYIADLNKVLNAALHYGNGRLLGNIGIIYLLDWPKLGEVIRALVLTAVTVLLPAALGIKKRNVRMLGFLLMLCVSPGIFAQSYSWMSGFQNYLPQFLFFLIALVLIRHYPRRGRLGKMLSCIGILVCGICMQLYMEHSSLLNALFSAFLVFWCLRRSRKHAFPSILLLVGAVAGLGLMIAIPRLYSEIGAGAYRSTYLSAGVKHFIYGVSRNAVMLIGMFSENVVALGVLASIQLTRVQRHRAMLSERACSAVAIGLLAPIAVFAVSLVTGLRSMYGKLAPAESAGLAVSFLVYAGSSLYSERVILKATKENVCTDAGLLLLFSVISVLPMLVVWPLGYRSLFHAYMFLVAGILILAERYLFLAENRAAGSVITKGIVICLTCTIFAQSLIFSDIRRLTGIREESVRAAIESGEESVDYFMIPSCYVYDYWSTDRYELYYRNIYGKMIRLNLLPAEVWLRDHYYGYE